MSESTGKQNGTPHAGFDKRPLEICVEIGLSALDKLQVAIDNTTTLKDLKCKIEFLSGIPSDLFELDHNDTVLTESLLPLMREFEGVGVVEVLKMKILPVWERFISTCLKAENSQVRARIRVKMHGVTKEERIFVACFVAARQANSCLLFGILPSNKMIARTVRLSERNLLHAAVIGGHTNCIANILMHGGGKLMNMEDVYSQTPLTMARTLGKGDIVNMLEAYKMVSLRSEGSLKGTNDDDSGYECIITSQSLEESKDSEEDYALSSDGEDNETQKISPEQNLKGTLDETSSSSSTTCHFLDGFAGHDGSTTTTTNDVKTGFGGTSKNLSKEQIQNGEENGSNGYEYKTTFNKDSLIRGDNRETYLSAEQSVENKYVLTRQESLEVSCQENENFSKTAKKINVKRESEEKEDEGESLNCNLGKNKDSGILPKKEENGRVNCLSGMPEKATETDWMINGNRREDVVMDTDKCLNNGAIEWISNDSENPTKRGSHILNGKSFDSETQQNTDVLTEDKQSDTFNTGNPLTGNQPGSAKSDGNSLLRRRKKGMPSLIVSRTSSGLSSSFETLNLLDSMGKNTAEVESVAVNCEDTTRTVDKQVCVPPIIKTSWIPKPPSKPIPIVNRQQMRRRKFSTGSPTSGSPKYSSRNDMENYLEEAWRRASDSDVQESLPCPVPPTRPRSYSTPHPPDLSQISETTPSFESQSYKILNAPVIKTPNRRQSVAGCGRRNSISLTFDEWLETKKKQNRRNSLSVQKEKKRRLSLGNQPALRLTRNINYEQWLAMKTMAPERKASHDVTNSCHGNERSREESERAFKIWLQKKDEEAFEREQRLLDEAISRSRSLK